MHPNRFGRDIAILFAVVLVLYIGAYHGVEHLRARKGPWTVGFGVNDMGQPLVEIRQPALGIQSVKLVFPEERAGQKDDGDLITFEAPQKTPYDVPYGRVIYEDLTFLPGAVTFDLFGHEIELLPRTLIVNRHEQSWTREATLTLWSTNKVKEIRVPKAR